MSSVVSVVLKCENGTLLGEQHVAHGNEQAPCINSHRFHFHFRPRARQKPLQSSVRSQLRHVAIKSASNRQRIFPDLVVIFEEGGWAGQHCLPAHQRSTLLFSLRYRRVTAFTRCILAVPRRRSHRNIVRASKE